MYELGAAIIGTVLAAIGTATQVNEVLEIISLVFTILGAIVSFIVVPLLSWYRTAKKDGKITPDEIKEAAKTLEDGLKKTEKVIKDQKADHDKREDIKKEKGNHE